MQTKLRRYYGFLTLEDDCEIFYMMGAEYIPEAAGGLALERPGDRDQMAVRPDRDLRPRRELARFRAVTRGTDHRRNWLYWAPLPGAADGRQP